MKKIFPIAFVFDLLILDQLSKWAARTYLGTPVEILDFFRLRFVENEGIAFSLPVAQYIVIPLSFIVLGWLGWQIYHSALGTKNKVAVQRGGLWMIYAYVFIFAGAAGNLIDRILYGKVADFLSFWSFPVFNLADAWITIGVGLFIGGEFFLSKKAVVSTDR